MIYLLTLSLHAAPPSEREVELMNTLQTAADFSEKARTMMHELDDIRVRTIRSLEEQNWNLKLLAGGLGICFIFMGALLTNYRDLLVTAIKR